MPAGLGKPPKKGLPCWEKVIMSVTIHRCRITGVAGALDTAHTTAMCNEMTHMQGLRIKLNEHGLTPSKARFRFWLAGYVFGLGSRVLGRRAWSCGEMAALPGKPGRDVHYPMICCEHASEPRRN